MTKYDCVIWDWNGTLLDDVTLALSVVNEILGEYGVAALTTSRYRDIFDFPVRLYYERAGVDLERNDFRQISEQFCSRFEDRLHLAQIFPAVPRVVQTIRSTGIRQFVLSSTEQSALTRMIHRFGLAELVDSAHGLQDTFATGKVEAGRALVHQQRIESNRTVMIGDTTHDAEVARQLGMDCLLLTSGHHSVERLSALGLPMFDSLETLSVNLL